MKRARAGATLAAMLLALFAAARFDAALAQTPDSASQQQREVTPKKLTAKPKPRSKAQPKKKPRPRPVPKPSAARDLELGTRAR